MQGKRDMCGGGLATTLASESTWGIGDWIYLPAATTARGPRGKIERKKNSPLTPSSGTTTFPNRRVRPELWPTMGSSPLQSLAGWTVIRSWQWT
ncbi:uncharacterized protein PpBr36_10587 [Pyricularia pennisetigena]|uniref:uncharacterized protein n=1 Tax=Pyricularia pennisetigena TaxID=1578925 RepID=UPI001151F003|nr:uncharacterized protein PpBr36_10587 [Pyricularia pennisetigena]TLS21135.1 hypothetical protein PpBr36_10587 [Pyricularia pennisetigena]